MKEVDGMAIMTAETWKKEADEVYKGLLEIESAAEFGSPAYMELFETYAIRKGLI